MKTGPNPPILYSFRRCPYAMRTRLALASSHTKCELREIILRNKPAHMLVLSSKGTVPVLWLSSGKVIDESMEVMQWALEENDPEGLLTYNGTQEATASELIATMDGTFKYNLDRYKYASQYEAADALKHRARCCEQIEKLNHYLNGKPWLFGEHPKLADFAILPFVRQFRIAAPNWFDDQTQWQYVQKWLDNFLNSKRLANIMEKYPLWVDGDTPIYFP